MPQDHGLNCILIGEGATHLNCTRLLLENDFTLTGIVSDDPEVAHLALPHDIPCSSGYPFLKELLENSDCDYLFSIANRYIISEELLTMPRELAINYHNAPLPRYAGVHAPAWALLNGESTHGITWHVMSPLVDGGDILEQLIFPIDPEETTLTLNIKCFEAALTAFQNLLRQIKRNEISRIPQKLEKRTYFSQKERSPMGAILPFERGAEQVLRLVNALNFGFSDNTMSSARILVEGQCLSVGTAQIKNTESSSPPGTIVSINQDELQISTGSKDVVLKDIMNVRGRKLSLEDDLVGKLITSDDSLRSLSDHEIVSIENLDAMLHRHEAFWVRQLEHTHPVQLSFNRETVCEVADDIEHLILKLPLPKSFVHHVRENLPEHEIADALIAVFAIYLSRTCHEQSFDIGFSHHTVRSETASFEELFALHVPFHFKLSLDQAFHEIVADIASLRRKLTRRKTFYRDIHARYRRLRGKPELSKDNLFPLTIDFVPSLNEVFSIPDQNVFRIIIPEQEKGWYFSFNPQYHDRDSVGRAVNNMKTLIDEIVEKISQPHVHFSLLSGEEKKIVLNEWNNTKVSLEQGRYVHHHIEEVAENFPDAIALVIGQHSITYGELNSRVNRLARYLIKMGVQAEQHIAFCLDRSVELVVSLLAIMKTGAAYVPLDPAYPPKRIMEMWSQTGISIVISQLSIADRFQFKREITICLDRDWPIISLENSVNPVVEIHSECMAYIIFTSGSTAQPKGVMATYGGLYNHFYSHLGFLDHQQGHHVLHLVSFSFDAGTSHLLTALGAGATMEMLSSGMNTINVDLDLFLLSRSITHILVPSSVLDLFKRGEYPALKSIKVGGEICNPELKAYWSRNRRFIVAYGPTEATICSTAINYDLSMDEPVIGYPINNVRVYVLDSLLEPVPVMSTGEILVAGAGITRGYINSPSETAEKFIPDHLSRNGGQRLYKSGDWGRYQQSGVLVFEGRFDGQVKIRGYRIELGEIENALLLYPGVKQAVLVMIDDDRRGKNLIAFISGELKAGSSEQEIRSHLRMKLPLFMCPAEIMELPSLPLTPSRKIDKSKLIEIYHDQHADVETGERNQPSLENSLIRIWKEVLPTRSIDRKDNFFDLGGNSLDAVRMMENIEGLLGLRLPLSVLITAPTVKELAEQITLRHRDKEFFPLVPIQEGGSRPVFYCIPGLGGNILQFYNLSRFLGNDQPFYGLQARGLDGVEKPLESVEEIAEDFARIITSFQSQGPYYLGGVSFGGLIALEVARFLLEEGKDVGILVFFDTSFPDYQARKRSFNPAFLSLYKLFVRIEYHRRIILALNGKERREYFIDKVRRIKRTDPGRNDHDGPLPAHIRRVKTVQKKAHDAYTPKPYPGRITLLRGTMKEPRWIGISDLGWKNYAGKGIETINVPGGHGSLIRYPYLVRSTARALRKILDREFKLNCPRTVSQSQTESKDYQYKPNK